MTATGSVVRVSAIVPARDEEETIAACVESLVPQKEIGEILVVNDQSADRTAEIVRRLTARYPQLRLLEVADLPAGFCKSRPNFTACCPV